MAKQNEAGALSFMGIGCGGPQQILGSTHKSSIGSAQKAATGAYLTITLDYPPELDLLQKNYAQKQQNHYVY